MTLCLIGPVVLLVVFFALTLLRLMDPGSPNADLLVKVIEMEHSTPEKRHPKGTDYSNMIPSS
ncbi:hypothetical protein [Pseudodesulfovibrio sp. zrk46]|uniref:hypothetical protein n=1 Tax=Pseudodesulfovibrio sp. zrk46 TaxID=2725288 RepID=UPI00144988BC|nr:hypothetical protein [Pseudodesulfovibrio sp. zrk46]QJB56087.1 hypothetical protein HFN16_06530 [Pseudodesulfovibrio sp. zrk46]